VLAGTAVVVLAAAVLLERWPSARAAPRFPDALDLGGGTVVFVSDGAVVHEDYIRAGNGGLDLLVRSRAPLPALTLIAEGEGVLRLAGRPPIALRPRGTRAELPLSPIKALVGRRGVDETLYRHHLEVQAAEGAVLRLEAIRANDAPAGEDGGSGLSSR
jgi:hypothetical protein